MQDQEIIDLMEDLQGVGLHTPSVKEMLKFVAKTKGDLWPADEAVFVATFWGSSEYSIKDLKTPPNSLSGYREAAIEFCRNPREYGSLLKELGLRYWTSDTGWIEGDYVMFLIGSAKDEE